MDSLVEFHVQTVLRSGNEEVVIELVAYFLEQLQALLQAFLGTAHAHVFPHDVTQFLMDGVNGTLTLNIHQSVNFLLNGGLGLYELLTIGRYLGPQCLIGQVVLNGVRQHEITVGQALHQRRSTQTRSEEHTSELQSRQYLVCRLLLEKKKKHPLT